MQYIRVSKIIKNGTSLAVVIPKEILVALKMQRGDQIAFGIYNDNTLTITKVNPQDLNIWKT
jgi:antitoxin component of MazEF toxin-antitoxin module